MAPLSRRDIDFTHTAPQSWNQGIDESRLTDPRMTDEDGEVALQQGCYLVEAVACHQVCGNDLQIEAVKQCREITRVGEIGFRHAQKGWDTCFACCDQAPFHHSHARCRIRRSGDDNHEIRVGDNDFFPTPVFGLFETASQDVGAFLDVRDSCQRVHPAAEVAGEAHKVSNDNCAPRNLAGLHRLQQRA